MPQKPPKHPPAQHGVPPGVQALPTGMQLAMSGAGCVTTVSVHWAVWLCVELLLLSTSAWKGSQKATNDGSVLLNSRCDKFTAAIQICGCMQPFGKGVPCVDDGLSKLSLG